MRTPAHRRLVGRGYGGQRPAVHRKDFAAARRDLRRALQFRVRRVPVRLVHQAQGYAGCAVIQGLLDQAVQARKLPFIQRPACIAADGYPAAHVPIQRYDVHRQAVKRRGKAGQR